MRSVSRVGDGVFRQVHAIGLRRWPLNARATHVKARARIRWKCTPASMAATTLAAVMVGGCGGKSDAAQNQGGLPPSHSLPGGRAPIAALTPASTTPAVKRPRQPRARWSVVASVGGQPAAWIAQRSGVTLLRFDQHKLHLALHAGSHEPGGTAWTYGDRIGTHEIHRVVAAFNGGFKLNYGSVGFMADGRVAVPLKSGLGSIVTYMDGATQIGAWHEGVPASGLGVASVLQNLHLLVDHRVMASSVASCIRSCWGWTLGGGSEVARSALGIRSDGQLVWAAGKHLSPAAIGQGLVGAGAVRAVELDINPEWIAGYLYVHHGGVPTAVPVVPGQFGIPGRLLTPYGRDFFTILAN